MKATSPRRRRLTRREWLQRGSCGFGGLALGALAASARGADDYAPRSHRRRGRPKAPEEPATRRHHVPQVKSVIFLFMPGGPSQIDTFDFKPGREPRLTPRAKAAFARLNAHRGRRAEPVGSSPFGFGRHGESGLPISELFTHLAQHADDLCLLNAMETESSAHTSAEASFHTGGSNRGGGELPSLGAWTYYGLGNHSSTLPGYLTINYRGSAQNFGNGFLPAKYQGVRLEIGDQKRPFFGEEVKGGTANVNNRHYTTSGQRRQLDFVQRMNAGFANTLGGAERIEAVIDSFERGYDMQDTFNSLLDAQTASPAERKLYRLDDEVTASFGEQCLLARRMAEQGVPFIQLNHSPRGSMTWDHHSQLSTRLAQSCAETDAPIAALLTDLKCRGMLDQTLVVWGGEFGRTPAKGDGRSHQNRGFTMWMAGGGIRGGIRHGATDEAGGAIAEGATTFNDLHATILLQMGFDPTRLGYRQAQRELFSEAKKGRVLTAILA